MSQTNTTLTMVRTGTRSPEEVDRAKEDPTAVAFVIAVTVAETTHLQSIHLKKNQRRSNFQTNNYQNRATCS